MMCLGVLISVIWSYLLGIDAFASKFFSQLVCTGEVFCPFRLNPSVQSLIQIRACPLHEAPGEMPPPSRCPPSPKFPPAQQPTYGHDPATESKLDRWVEAKRNRDKLSLQHGLVPECLLVFFNTKNSEGGFSGSSRGRFLRSGVGKRQTEQTAQCTRSTFYIEI